MNELAKFVGSLGLCVVAFFWGLFTFVKCWALIAVPMGAHRIDQWQAYGVMILVAHIIYPTLYLYVKKEVGKEGTGALAKFAFNSMGASAMGWLTAWIIFG
jgi:hypothetical protein